MWNTERHRMSARRPLVARERPATLAVGVLIAAGCPTLSAGSPSIRDAFEAYRARGLMFERSMSAEERRADLAPELVDAILRIEGVFDPTRIGAFGPALRMSVRSGTASMANVFGDYWRRADDDPNLHYRVRYLAQAWLDPPAPVCENFRRFRPDDVAVALDRPTAADCARLARRAANASLTTGALAITAAPTALPVFAAPYPGSRFTPAALRAIVDARLKAVEARAWFISRAR